MTTPNAAAHFQRLTERYANDRRVTPGKMLVSEGLRVDGRFFVALVDDRLLVKLPHDRTAELISAGIARPFESGKGRVMREWALVSHSASRRWAALADEALTFVGA